MGKEKIIPILAMIVVVIGVTSSLYVYAQESELEKQREKYNQENIITIDNLEYNLEELFTLIDNKTVIADDEKIAGIALDGLIIYTDIECPSCHEYTFKASDNYQQTVTWEMMQTGILTDYNRVIFPETAHSFWVRNVIEIEVK